MLYDVEQVADKLKVSKMTIYNKIKLKEFKDKVIIKAGKRYVDEDLLNLIKDTLKTSVELENNIESKDIEQEQKEEIPRDEESLNNFKDDYINYLKEENKKLWEEIQDLNNRLAAEQELHKNTQVLFRGQQEPKLLEEHFKELDLKLMDLREQMEQRKENQKKKEGILQKLFKK